MGGGGEVGVRGEGLEVRAQGSGLRAQGSGLRGQGSRVWGLGVGRWVVGARERIVFKCNFKKIIFVSNAPGIVCSAGMSASRGPTTG